MLTTDKVHSSGKHHLQSPKGFPMFESSHLYIACFHMRFVSGTRYQGTPQWTIDPRPSRDRFLEWVATQAIRSISRNPVNEFIVSAQWGEAMGLSCAIESASQQGSEISKKDLLTHLAVNVFTFDSPSHQTNAYQYTMIKNPEKGFLEGILNRQSESEKSYGQLRITADKDTTTPSDREILDVIDRAGLGRDELIDILKAIDPMYANELD